MRILHVIPSLSLRHGGPSVIARAIAGGLAQAGVRVDVVATDAEDAGRMRVPLGQALVEEGVTYRYFARQTRFYTASLPLAHWLARHVADYDLVHIHALFSFSSLAAAAVAARSGVPYIVRPLGTLNQWGMTNRRPLLKQLSFNLFERRVLAGAAAIHYTSEQERLEAEALGAPQRAVVIPNPVEIADPVPAHADQQLCERYPQLAGRKVILFLSRIDPKKGLDLLLPAFAELLRSTPNAALLIAGNGEPPYLQSLRADTEQLGITDSVVWAGFLASDDKLAAYAGADLFVLPSYSENFANVVAEAMAYGLPVVVSDQVALHSEVAAAAAGLVVPCEAGALAAALARLCSDAELRRRMGVAGARLAREQFSPAAVTNRILATYGEILDAVVPANDRNEQSEGMAWQSKIQNPKSKIQSGSPSITQLPISVIILTFNEEQNLPDCLRSIAEWAGEIFVVDSGSTDATLSIARQFGAIVIEHPFETHGQQWAWALRNVPVTHEWVFGLDADQRVTPELRDELSGLLQQPAQLAGVDGMFVKRRQVFRGRWIRHGGYYPKYLLKIFRPQKVLFDERDLMDHHFYIDGQVLKLNHDIIEANQKEDDIAFWIAKHNRYAVLHAREELIRRRASEAWLLRAALFGNPDQRVIWLKSRWYRLPLYVRPFLYFFLRYLLQRGFLDGKQGFIFHFLQGFWYRLLVDIHLDEQLRLDGNAHEPRALEASARQ